MVRFFSAILWCFLVIPVAWGAEDVVSKSAEVAEEVSRFNGQSSEPEENPTKLGVAKLPVSSPFDPGLSKQERESIQARVAKILSGEGRVPAANKKKPSSK